MASWEWLVTDDAIDRKSTRELINKIGIQHRIYKVDYQVIIIIDMCARIVGDR